jgi:hypothetical protein
MITFQEIEPIGLCIATQGLFDKRFRSNFGDTMILRDKDAALEPTLMKIKRELNSGMSERKYLEGHKMAIVNNIDKILALAGRYVSTSINETDAIVTNGKGLMKKVLNAESFDEIGTMEGEFKSKITLPVYELFMKKFRG